MPLLRLEPCALKGACTVLRGRGGSDVALPPDKAARGTESGPLGGHARPYPWGDAEPDRTLCNFGNNEKGTTPVGKYSPKGDSPYGCADMAGNMWEWTRSKYKTYPYIAAVSYTHLTLPTILRV